MDAHQSSTAYFNIITNYWIHTAQLGTGPFPSDLIQPQEISDEPQT